ncbi:hypothetical protein BV25DRAFT_1902454 [Artomyces pyxidatus]|uniref:Uncharacterized protein n=1 Tax=Artomyces pyxidatus TaxID=48021 RepID=A0ACB8SNE6_9AGAM|nr:hypothetical protein BV25DRAFT_1902454 [Artomyces pyxidatus]
MDATTLRLLSRAQLQKLAVKCHIKANAKSEKIIAQLVAAHPVPFLDAPKPNNSNSRRSRAPSRESSHTVMIQEKRTIRGKVATPSESTPVPVKIRRRSGRIAKVQAERYTDDIQVKREWIIEGNQEAEGKTSVPSVGARADSPSAALRAQSGRASEGLLTVPSTSGEVDTQATVVPASPVPSPSPGVHHPSGVPGPSRQEPNTAPEPDASASDTPPTSLPPTQVLLEGAALTAAVDDLISTVAARLEPQPSGPAPSVGPAKEDVRQIMRRLSKMVNNKATHEAIDRLETLVRGVEAVLDDGVEAISYVQWVRVGIEERVLKPWKPKSEDAEQFAERIASSGAWIPGGKGKSVAGSKKRRTREDDSETPDVFGGGKAEGKRPEKRPRSARAFGGEAQ